MAILLAVLETVICAVSARNTRRLDLIFCLTGGDTSFALLHHDGQVSLSSMFLMAGQASSC